MTCSEFCDIARDLARGLDGPVAEGARVHLDGCAGCRERFEEEQRLSEGLAALAASMEPLSPSPALERRLRQAFRQRQPAPAWRWAPRWSWRWVVPAAAAIALTAVAVPWMGSRVDPLGGTDPVARLAAKAPEAAKPAVTASAAPAPRRPRVRRVRATAVLARQTTPPPEPAEEVMNFVPVRFAQALFPDEAAEVIRVSLPGSAMRRFGVYVPAEMAVQRVNADVLMGEDGVARAIRFVR